MTDILNLYRQLSENTFNHKKKVYNKVEDVKGITIFSSKNREDSKSLQYLFFAFILI